MFLLSSSSDFDYKLAHIKYHIHNTTEQYIVRCCESVRQEHYNLFQELSTICPHGTISHCWNLPGSFLCCRQHASHKSLDGSRKLPKNREREKKLKRYICWIAVDPDICQWSLHSNDVYHVKHNPCAWKKEPILAIWLENKQGPLCESNLGAMIWWSGVDVRPRIWSNPSNNVHNQRLDGGPSCTRATLQLTAGSLIP